MITGFCLDALRNSKMIFFEKNVSTNLKKNVTRLWIK